MRKTLIIGLVVLVILALVGAFFYFKPVKNKIVLPWIGTTVIDTTGFSIVPTLQDPVAGNTARCATFQLVWNDMINEIVQKDVVFTPQLPEAEHLNQQEFTEAMLSPAYYYKKFGRKTLALKAEIEQGIWEKFQEKSAILDKIDWSESALDGATPDEQRYLLYAMLKRIFTFPQAFDVLEKTDFGKGENLVKQVEYFGIDEESNDKLGNNVRVLFYEDEHHYAVTLETNEGDEVILYKNSDENSQNFNAIYANLSNKQKNFRGEKSFKNEDTLKVPKLDFNEIKEYEAFANKSFPTADPMFPIGRIEQAIQSIEFTIDEEGGRVKSEAVIDVTLKNGISFEEPPQPEPRHFNFDDTFFLFLKETEKDKPYFALKVYDITDFQK